MYDTIIQFENSIIITDSHRVSSNMLDYSLEFISFRINIISPSSHMWFLCVFKWLCLVALAISEALFAKNMCPFITNLQASSLGSCETIGCFLKAKAAREKARGCSSIVKDKSFTNKTRRVV